MSKKIWPEGIRIKLERVKKGEKAELGGSHFFGFPDIPEGFEFPIDEDENDLAFVCQLRLRDIPKNARENAGLPDDGLLLFFADVDYCFGNEDADPPCSNLQPIDKVHVEFVRPELLDEDHIMRGTIVDEDGNPCGLPVHRVVFDNSAEKTEEKHQLFGKPEDMPYEDYDEPARGFQMLLQIDSCEGDDFHVMFGDEGLYTFIIDPDTLASGDFSHVRGWLCSS